MKIEERRGKIHTFLQVHHTVPFVCYIPTVILQLSHTERVWYARYSVGCHKIDQWKFFWQGSKTQTCEDEMKQKRNQRFSDAHTAITTKRQMGGSNTKHIEAFVCRGARKNMGQYPTPDIQTTEQKNHWEGDIYVYHGGTVQQSDKEKIKQVRIHQSVVTIKGAAFDGCSNLTNIIIIDESTKNNLKHIGKKSFCHCTALTNVDFGTTNIETIDCDAFLGCTKLTTIRLPSTTKYIKNQCFRECTSLTTIDGLESTCVEIIGDRAFLRCPNLITVNLPATNYKNRCPKFLPLFGDQQPWSAWNVYWSHRRVCLFWLR